MRASFLLGILGMVISVGLSTGIYAADGNGSVLPLTVPEPASAEKTVSYSYQSSDVPPAPAADSEAGKTATPAGNDMCCPTCVEGEACGGCGARWVAGVEAVWLSPQKVGHPANYSVGPVGGTPTSVFDANSANVEGLYITPRIWLGYQGECWGLMARYWRMNEPGQVYAPFIIEDETLLGTKMNVDNVFKAETFDLEVTRLFCWRDTRNVASFGLRYGELRTVNSLSSVYDIVDGQGLYTGYAYSRQEFAGVGLTGGLTGLKPIGCPSNGLNLFYSARASLLWDGDASNRAETAASYWSGVSSSFAGDTAFSESDGSLFIGEVQVGVQWNFELSRHCSDAFLRFALEYQYWATTDTGWATSTSYAGNDAVRGTAHAYSGDTNLNLIGFTVATGFSW